MATRDMADGVACLACRRRAKALVGQGSTVARGALRPRGTRWGPPGPRRSSRGVRRWHSPATTATFRRRWCRNRAGERSGRERRAQGSSLRGSIGRRRAGRRGSTSGWSFGGQQWRRRPADGPGRWRRGSGASLGGGDPVPVVVWADGGRRVALHGEVRAAALMEAGGASGRASRGPRNSARSEGEREEAKMNLATSRQRWG